MNYRVNVFGWFAHPELTQESPHHASGNYGSLDQLAGIQWVKNNIAQFGGDPSKITIWGESGGSRSVNFLAASPLLKGLSRGAIAESHTTFGRMLTLAEAEANGVKFANAIGKKSLAALRAAPAEESAGGIDQESARTQRRDRRWLVPAARPLHDLFAGQAERHRPDHGRDQRRRRQYRRYRRRRRGGGARAVRRPTRLPPTPHGRSRHSASKADALLKLYPARDDAQAKQAYHDVYRDINFAGHRTWAKLQSTTGKAPAWLYLFSHVPPHPEGQRQQPAPSAGAVHFSEVIYVFNNLRMKDYPWTDLDRNVADTLATYWTNFAKTGNPNGPGAHNWPVYNPKDEFWLNIGDTVRLERFNSAGVDFIAAVQEELRRRPTAAGALN